MKQTAIKVLDSHRIMSIATLRPDGWPQNTIVGYANEGFDIFFLIFRSSQKFANIQHDSRVSIAIGEEPESLGELNAFYAAAQAHEITNAAQRDHAWRLLMGRHPNLADFEPPRISDTALMRLTCKYVSVLDFNQGIGHKEESSLGESLAAAPAALTKDEWGSSAAKEPGGKR